MREASSRGFREDGGKNDCFAWMFHSVAGDLQMALEGHGAHRPYAFPFPPSTNDAVALEGIIAAAAWLNEVIKKSADKKKGQHVGRSWKCK